MVGPSVLNFLFCDANSRFFFEITMYPFQRGDQPQLRLGRRRPAVAIAERGKAGQLQMGRPAMALTRKEDACCSFGQEEGDRP